MDQDDPQVDIPSILMPDMRSRMFRYFSLRPSYVLLDISIPIIDSN